LTENCQNRTKKQKRSIEKGPASEDPVKSDLEVCNENVLW